jgi:hypothetical protein
MADLLLHSMAEFLDIILTSLEIAEAREIVEVGAEYGTMTERLLAYTRERGGRFTSIDPDAGNDVELLFSDQAHAELVKRPSLEVLSSYAADAYLIDGDHNYYTVLRESQLIWEQIAREGNDFLVFYHDVCWPWARRDLYYDPTRIPPDYLQPHVWDRGVTLDDPGVVPGGFRGEGRWACAVREGGARNGVLTAIDDFVQGKEGKLTWACVPAVFGLGVLYAKEAAWSESLSAFLLPYHMNPLLQRLERNRLECYLGVIAWQDRYEKSNA